MYWLWINNEYIKVQYHQIPWNSYSIGRLDGPTLIGPDNTKYYYFKGILHRYNGPAIENDILYTWWLHGVRYETIGDYLEKNTYLNLTEKVLLNLKY